MRRNNLNSFRRNNFRSRTFPNIGRRYGRFFAGPFMPNYGTRAPVSNRMCDRFSTVNMKRRIYRYSRHH